MITRPADGASPTHLLLLFAFGLGTGCSQLPSPAGCPLCADPDSPELRKAYARSLRAARHPQPSKVADDLVALVPATDDLVWDEDGRVLMVTWTNAEFYRDQERFARAASFPLTVDTWLTAVPDAQRFCRALKLDEPSLVLRLEQRLGLPPERGKDVFLEIWVDPEDLFRPCPDPEVTDRRCRVDVRADGDDGRVRKRHRLPWTCDPARARPGEKPADPEHLRWLCDNWRDSFDNDELFANYPWTALGYTYDWGDPDDPRGASEFVAPRGTEVAFRSLNPTADYCSASSGLRP